MPRFERQRDRDVVHVALAEIANCGTRVFDERARFEFRAVAQTDRQHPLRAEFRAAQQDRVVRRPGDLFARKDVRQRAAEFFIRHLGCAVELAVREDGDDEGIRMKRAGRAR